MLKKKKKRKHTRLPLCSRFSSWAAATPRSDRPSDEISTNHRVLTVLETPFSQCQVEKNREIYF